MNKFSLAYVGINFLQRWLAQDKELVTVFTSYEQFVNAFRRYFIY